MTKIKKKELLAFIKRENDLKDVFQQCETDISKLFEFENDTS